MADEEMQEMVEGQSAADADVAAELEQLADAAQGVADAAGGLAGAESTTPKSVDFIKDLTLAVTVEVGRARMTIQDLLQLGQGSVVELEKLAGEALDIYVNGKRVAFGEAVIVNEKFGVRLKEIISPEERIEGLKN